MLILDIVKDKQPDIFKTLERVWGPFLHRDEWERIMQDEPKMGGE